MPQTSKLALELFQNNAANQTLGNTTFAQLNQLVQAGVVDKDLATPPGSPANEALYIVAASPTGAWSGKAGQLAYWLTATGAWQFIVPREGMLVHVNDEDTFYKYTGSAWAVFSGGGMSNPMTTSGDLIVGGASGAPDRLAKGADGQVLTMVSGSVAWAAPSGGGGSVSSVNGQTGVALIVQPNLLVNGNFSLNQRGFAGGALAAGSYGHDRWGAYNGGANYSVSGETVTLTSGALCQVIESAGLAGQSITVSVEDPSATVTVTIGNGTGADSATGSITSGSGRRGATLTVPVGVTGDLKIRLSGSTVTFKRVKVEQGIAATPLAPVDLALEQLRAARYFVRLTGNSGERGEVGLVTGAAVPVNFGVLIGTGVRMRATPTLSQSGMTVFLAGEGSARAVTSFPASPRVSTAGVFVFLQVEGAVPAGGNVAGTIRWGASPSYIQFDAELACTD